MKLEAYKEKIESEREKRRQFEKETLVPRREAEESARGQSDRKSEAVSVEQRKYDLRKASNPFLVSIIGSAICAVFLLYYLLRSLTATAQSDRKYNICIFFGVVIVLLVLLAVFRAYLKKRELGKQEELLKALRKEEQEALALTRKAEEARKEADSKAASMNREIERLEEEMYRAYPEEKQRREKEESEALQKRIDEKKAQEEAYDAMLADNEAKKEQLALAEEMFDSPKKFIRRDGYANEFEVLKASAEMGCEDAMSRLVMLYAGADYMSGVNADAKQALALAEKYAMPKEGSPMVAETMGEIYLFGKGDFEKDPEKACFWLAKAANRGRKNAMVNLGYCCYIGEGTEKDLEKAEYWFDKAAKQGDEQAFRLLEAIRNGVQIDAE